MQYAGASARNSRTRELFDSWISLTPGFQPVWSNLDKQPLSKVATNTVPLATIKQTEKSEAFTVGQHILGQHFNGQHFSGQHIGGQQVGRRRGQLRHPGIPKGPTTDVAGNGQPKEIQRRKQGRKTSTVIKHRLSSVSSGAPRHGAMCIGTTASNARVCKTIVGQYPTRTSQQDCICAHAARPSNRCCHTWRPVPRTCGWHV